jgi:hypothetical protein
VRARLVTARDQISDQSARSPEKPKGLSSPASLCEGIASVFVLAEGSGAVL